MTLGPIPWRVIREYCQILDLDEDQTEAMHHHIREMDKAYLEAVKKKT